MKFLKTVLIIIVLIGILFYIYREVENYRASPVSIAEKISGLDISNQSKIISFNEDWQCLNGDGYSIIRVKLSAADAHATRMKFKNYPKLSLLPENYKPIFIKVTDYGYYSLKVDINDGSYALVIFIENNKELYVELNVQ